VSRIHFGNMSPHHVSNWIAREAINTQTLGLVSHEELMRVVSEQYGTESGKSKKLACFVPIKTLLGIDIPKYAAIYFTLMSWNRYTHLAIESGVTTAVRVDVRRPFSMPQQTTLIGAEEVNELMLEATMVAGIPPEAPRG
jgi:hypothetical protein